jgi:hypothetical protein
MKRPPPDGKILSSKRGEIPWNFLAISLLFSKPVKIYKLGVCLLKFGVHSLQEIFCVEVE